MTADSPPAPRPVRRALNGAHLIRDAERERNKALLSEGFCWIEQERLETRELPSGPWESIGVAEAVHLDAPGLEIAAGSRVYIAPFEPWGVCPRCQHRYRVMGERILEQLPLRGQGDTSPDPFIWAGVELTPPLHNATMILLGGMRVWGDTWDRFPPDAEWVEIEWH